MADERNDSVTPADPPVDQATSAYDAAAPASAVDAGATGLYVPEATGAPHAEATAQAAGVGTAPGEPPGPEPADGATGAYPTRAEQRDGVATTSSADGVPGQVAPRPPHLAPGSPGRLKLQQFHARGGMGEIWLAEDHAIGRQVAVKRMRTGREHQISRFILEAQITGQLEHPSVVPIHDMGVGEDGLPYYVMKFVHGQTLRAALHAYHRGTPADTSRELAWQRLLQSFLALCQAVAYAHSRGVIHRDIKPGNVMIGSFGETLVLDWGLAKVLGHAEDPEHDRGVHLSDLSSQTMAGSALGSPSYMAPEMAEGRPERIDQASDVYLLGATLYEILTNQPPRQGKDLDDLLHRARHDPPPPPRVHAPGIPRALEAICMKAMALRKEDRYGSALAVAEDMQRYLAGQPVLIYPEPLLERAWRLAKRHRRALAGAAAVLVMLAILAFGADKLVEAERTRQEAERQTAALQQQEAARGQVADFRRLADEMRYYIASSDPIAEQAPYFDLAKGNAAAAAALAIADTWGPTLDNLPLESERTALRAELYDLLLLEVQNRSRQPAAPESAQTALALLDRAAVLQPPSRGAYRLRAHWLQATGDKAQAKAAQRSADDPATAATTLDYFLLGEQYRNEATRLDVARAADKSPVNREPLLRAVEQYRAALRGDPAHFWSHFQLGRCYLALGQRAEAVAALNACVALRPASAWGYSIRGFTLATLGRYRDAETDLDKALQLDPQALPARLNRGVVYREQGKNEAALADFAVLLDAPPERQLIEAAYYRGQLYLQRAERAKDAAQGAALLSARDDCDRVIAARPAFRPAYRLRAQVHLLLGDGAAACADLDAYLAEPGVAADSAAALEQRGRYLWHLLPQLPAAAQPATLELARADLAKAAAEPGASPALLLDLGAVLEQLGRTNEALAVYSRGLQRAPDHAKLRTARGWLNAQLNRLDQARTDFTRAVRVEPTLSEAHTGLGYVEARRKGADAAGREANLALVHGAGDYLVLHNVACIHATLGEGTGEPAEQHLDAALALLRRAVELWQRGGTGPSEIQLIHNEPAFAVLRRRRPAELAAVTQRP